MNAETGARQKALLRLIAMGGAAPAEQASRGPGRSGEGGSVNRFSTDRVRAEDAKPSPYEGPAMAEGYGSWRPAGADGPEGEGAEGGRGSRGPPLGAEADDRPAV